ncbi:WYL domain-containing protein [Streptomyces sp. Z26]|uniref:helix-turn-helix transcriptional regulator n=1 Tax=Streptomyces sp. Z26 TaxID=2500177 RepID=UPI000EF1751B|nr:WYL domain-containing protein [Streptomyces sp. Z26]RLL66427.1 WYL domain-containing protein [Streptomyces sp. Z26]
MSRPTGRVLTLLELLQSGGTRTSAELAARLGVDGRSVRRYVEQLTDLGIPVEAVRGRYGGYRLAAGYRLPPLMLDDDEALAVLLGLVAGRRTGLLTAGGPMADTAGETAAAKIRRVLPAPLARRLDAVLETLALTEPSGTLPPATTAPPPDTGTLLTLADAVRHRRPVALRYTDRHGRRSDRVLHPYGVVVHAGRWYVTGADPDADPGDGDGDGGTGGGERTFRLDRVAEARALPGTFEAPPERDPAARLLAGFADAPYRHEVTLRVHATFGAIRARLPASVARVTEIPEETRTPQAPEGTAAAERTDGRWHRVELRVESLDWLPGVLASLDRPFVVERPDALRGLVAAAAERLAARAHARADHGRAPDTAWPDTA